MRTLVRGGEAPLASLGSADHGGTHASQVRHLANGQAVARAPQSKWVVQVTACRAVLHSLPFHRSKNHSDVSIRDSHRSCQRSGDALESGHGRVNR